MLEYPDSIVYAKEMNDTLKGKKIISVVMNQSPHKFAFFTMDTEEYPMILEGLEVKGCKAVAGMVEVDFDEFKLVFNDGAYPRYYAPGEKHPEKHQMMIEMDDHSVITVSIQMYGGISLMEHQNSTNLYYNIAGSKPVPLSDEFSYEYFRHLYEESSEKLSAKAFLATEQRIPGLGNGVLQDILYRAGIHPKRSIRTFSEEELRKLYDSIRSVMTEIKDHGGRDTEKDFFGNEGKYITYLSKKTYLTPCPICGSEIRKAAFMGGTIYFCEKCQPL